MAPSKLRVFYAQPGVCPFRARTYNQISPDERASYPSILRSFRGTILRTWKGELDCASSFVVGIHSAFVASASHALVGAQIRSRGEGPMGKDIMPSPAFF